MNCIHITIDIVELPKDIVLESNGQILISFDGIQIMMNHIATSLDVVLAANNSILIPFLNDVALTNEDVSEPLVDRILPSLDFVTATDQLVALPVKHIVMTVHVVVISLVDCVSAPVYGVS